ncbi:uncharacterized protein LOC131626634 [Vicia villosa]|uniref:uncharacterized protein LOC131626634 n=1 Tax=Vicia villosa TaxID=3911 RepID=UPI00273B3359|nr:uncharacterized protein LOC131626634 [Vicia villosa]
MVGVTSTEKTFAIGFVFLECEKKDGFRWALEVCRSLLKKHVEMLKAIVMDRDPALMNAVAKVFPSSDALLFRYHISCNVRSKVKPAVGTKQVATEGGKAVKPVVIVDQIMDAWARIASSSTKELYADVIGNVSRAGLNYIFHEANRGETIGGDTAKCGCTITITYGLPCACATAKKVRLGEPITMNEINPHWKRLSFDDDDGCVEEDSNISIIYELEAIQERFLKADDYTKLYMKEQLRRIEFPETTDMKPPSQSVKTTDAPKKVRYTLNDNSTTQSPSYSEHVDKIFPDSPTTKSQKSQNSSNKGARLSKPPPTPIPPQVPQVSTPILTPIVPKVPIPTLIAPSIEEVVSTLLGKGEDAHELVRHDLIDELVNHKDSYTRMDLRKGVTYDPSVDTSTELSVTEIVWSIFSKGFYIFGVSRFALHTSTNSKHKHTPQAQKCLALGQMDVTEHQ